MKTKLIIASLLFGVAGLVFAAEPDRTVLPIQPYQKVGKVAPAIRDSDPIQ